MDDRIRARLDMIEPGIFFVLCENKDGGITGRTYTSVAEALKDVQVVNSSRRHQHHQPQTLSLAA